MNILAVDTTGSALSVALRVGARTFAHHRAHAKPHDETLLPAIDRLLKKAGLPLKRLDAIAAATGPGRFTGIRIGMAYAAVAARCISAKAIGISRFEAAAFVRRETRFCVVLPGFRGEKYYQIFGRRGAVGKPVWAAFLPPLDMPIIEADPTARELLEPAARWLERKSLPRFEPLYLKPAGYEAKKG